MTKDKTTVEVNASTVEEAIEKGLDQFYLPRDAVDIEVLDEDHQTGMQTVWHISEVCAKLGNQVLILYIFSTENWYHLVEEVDYLMLLAEKYTARELPELQRNGVCLQLMGKREFLPAPVLNALDWTIMQTRDNSRLVLNLALNYGRRDEIVDAIKAILIENEQGALDGMNLDENTLARYLCYPDCPDVDLVIHTSGEWRLSNFLLWCAANVVFLGLTILWPDFKQEHQEAISIYTKQISGQHVGS